MVFGNNRFQQEIKQLQLKINKLETELKNLQESKKEVVVPIQIKNTVEEKVEENVKEKIVIKEINKEIFIKLPCECYVKDIMVIQKLNDKINETINLYNEKQEYYNIILLENKILTEKIENLECIIKENQQQFIDNISQYKQDSIMIRNQNNMLRKEISDIEIEKQDLKNEYNLKMTRMESLYTIRRI
jgi:cell division septum initiation protein DivIVA